MYIEYCTCVKVSKAAAYRAGVPHGCQFQFWLPPFLAWDVLGKEAKMMQVFRCAHQQVRPGRSSCLWFWPEPGLAVVASWEINQQKEALSFPLFLSLLFFQTNQNISLTKSAY